MNNLLVLPFLIPFAMGAIMILFSKQIGLQRFLSGLTAISMLGVAIYLLSIVRAEGVVVLEVGDWAAPFGIVLVADLFAAIMVLMSAIVGLLCLFFAFRTIAPEREKFYFYPFYFFLLTGVNGAFLTGDIFNLFVFFEVMLISSYVLIVMGGTNYQLRESLKYVVMNIFASILFIATMAFTYAVTGTLNMAQLAERVAELEQVGVLNVIAMFYFIVFGMKGALFPLYFWLPRSYFGPPAAVAALFGGLLTKVGIYAIIRTFTLIFPHNQEFTQPILIWVGAITIVIGGLGAVSNFDFKRILSYHIVSQVGYMVIGLGLYTSLAIAAAIYYIVHNIIVKTALFFYAGTAQRITGTTDLKQMGGLLKTHPLLGWMFFITGIAIAGIPPFSGFVSKLSLVVSSFETEQYVVGGIALAVGMLTLFSMIKIFMYVFWGEQKHTKAQGKTKVGDLLLPAIPLVILTTVLGVAAQPILSFFLEASNQLLDPSIYIDSVLKGGGA